jgi:hypothetical protein
VLKADGATSDTTVRALREGQSPGLDILGEPALGIMSNRMTDAQGEKITRWARQLAGWNDCVSFPTDTW